MSARVRARTPEATCGGIGAEILYEKSYALLVGVSNYTGCWSPLPGVAKDLVQLEVILREHGFDVEVVQDPDIQTLLVCLRDFSAKKGQGDNDRLLFFFAGHGFTVGQGYGLEMAYLVPIGATNPQKDIAEFRRTALAMDQLEVHAKEIASKHALFIFDSCFSGMILEHEYRSAPLYIQEQTSQPVRHFIAAGSADERVPDESSFMKYFIRALKGDADIDGDGYFTASQLGQFIYEGVVEDTDGLQHPRQGKFRHSKLSRGEYIFEVPSRYLTTVGDVPDEPSEPSFSLDDLISKVGELEKGSMEIRSKWDNWLTEMQNAYTEIETFEESRAPIRFKLAAWERFLRSFAEKSPYSDIDDELRREARARRASLRAASQHAREFGRQPTLLRDTQAPKGRVDDLKSDTAAPPATEAGSEIRREIFCNIPFLRLPAGVFRMGSAIGEPERFEDEIVRTVQISHPFWVSETTITKKQWYAILSDDPSYFKNNTDDCPVESVTWYDALLFANMLSSLASYEPSYEIQLEKSSNETDRKRVTFKGLICDGFRLLTEAEWEYACRAGTETPFNTGPSLETDHANYDGNFPYNQGAAGVNRGQPIPVGSFAPNQWGLFEMHGNVSEWVWDVYATPPTDEVSDPIGPDSDGPRVIRGGGWADDARTCRSAARMRALPGFRDGNLGFRLARTDLPHKDN